MLGKFSQSQSQLKLTLLFFSF